MLSELGVARSEGLMKGIANQLLDAWQADGRFRPAPKGAIYPCHTANAARVLCRLGYTKGKRLFFYVYVLSFYDAARRNATFRRALEMLETRLVEGHMLVDNPNRKLACLSFCEKGRPSRLATKRYREILKNTDR